MGTIAHEIEVVVTHVHRVSRSVWRSSGSSGPTGDAFGEDHAILVVEIADDAVRRIDAYTVDDLPAALTRYDEIVRLANTGGRPGHLNHTYRLACGIDDDHWIARSWDALTSFDPARYEELLAADFRSVDHRPVALGVVGRDEFLEWLRATPPEASWSIPVIHRLSDRGMVVEHEESWADAAGDTRMLIVIEFGDGLTTRMDTYEVDDLDAALARYDEITAAKRQTLTNAAWEAAQRRQRAGSEMGLIAIRGDDLCLYRAEILNADGGLTERLVVDETRDGECIRTDAFEPGHEENAFAEMDRRYRLASGIGDDHWIAGHWGVISSADFTEIQPVLHPDFEFVERRPLAWPNGGAADWNEWLTPNNAPLELTIRALHRLCDHGVVSLRSERFEDGDLGVTESVQVNEVEDGQVRRVITFAPEDLDRALAEFDAFVARRSSRGLTNSAWRSMQQGAAMWREGDREGVAGLLADDFVGTTHEPIMAAIDDDRGAYDKELYLEVMFDPLVFGPAGANELELVAVRGEELCLYRTRTTTPDGDVHERVVIAEVHDGRCVGMEFFPHDRFSVAQIALDRRWLTLLGFADDHPWHAVLDWFYENDAARIASELPDHYRFVDHRRLTYPDGDRSQLIANLNTQLAGQLTSSSPAGSASPIGSRSSSTTSSRPGDGSDPVGSCSAGSGPTAGSSTWSSSTSTTSPQQWRPSTGFSPRRVRSATGLGPLTNAAWEVVRTERSLDSATGQHELVAVRSDRFCLTRFTGTDLDGQATELLVVSEVVDGRVERSTSFEADDLAAALTELDAWYCAEIDEPEIHDWMIRMAAAFGHGNFEDFRSLVTDDFESVDERRLGLGRRTADQWAASYVSLVGLQHPVSCGSSGTTDRSGSASIGRASVATAPSGIRWS